MKTWQTFLESKENKEDFFEKRRLGAKKIANEAKAKDNKLTYWHFQAKDQPYKEVIFAIKTGKKESYFRSKWNPLLAQLRKKLSQETFQKTMGELEVWGEAIAELF